MSERTFEFKDGTSNKFWAISVSGDSHTVRFGKVGTAGQAKTKTFADAAKARADADKLIAEKTGKGYKETTAASAAPVAAAAAPPKKAAAKKAKVAAPAAEEPKPAAPTPPPQPVSPATTVAIDLSPEDYLWVTYPVPKPHYEPPADSAGAGKELLRKLRDRERLFTGNVGYWMDHNYTDTARVAAVPRLTAAEADEARAVLRPLVVVSPTVSEIGEPLPPEFGLAALLGMHPEVEAVVTSWPNGYASAKQEFAAFYKAPERMVFGLGSREKVVHHGRRLKLPFAMTEHIRGWLAHTGDTALDVVRDAILAIKNRNEAEQKCRELARVKTPAAAPFMLELALESKAMRVARAWLDEDPHRAAEGLAAVAAGRGKLADAAKEYTTDPRVTGQASASPDKVVAGNATTPIPVPAVAIELSPEDLLWVTYGPRPAAPPAKPKEVTAKKFLAGLNDPKELSGEVHSWSANDPFRWLRDLMPTVARLTDAEREQAQAELRPQVDMAAWVSRYNDFTPPAFALAAVLGMHEEIEAVVSSWPDGSQSYTAGHFPHNFVHPALLVLALGSKAKVVAQARRLNLYLNRPEYVVGWLAHTGTDALDVIRDSILAAEKKEEAEPLAREFGRVKAAAAAPFMLEIALESKAPAVARSWLAQNPALAADGLARTATGKGKLADAAKDVFRELKANGHTDAIRAAIAAHPDAAATLQAILDHQEKTYPALDRAAMPAGLKAAFDGLAKKAGTLPDWLPLATLPPVLVGGAKLSDADTKVLLDWFRAQKGDARPDVAVALKKHADTRSLDSFAWAVFSAWNRAGFPSKEKWCLLTCGWIGGDNCARQLTPLIREWPGQSQHQRAKTGLEVLRMIGTDIALTMINGCAQKLKFAALKQRARELMDLIASDRGMSRAELEDRIVPDLDMDEKGERVFDYGPRQFRLVIGPDYKPRAKGPDDKVKDSLPAPNSKDDAEKAKLAKADWTAFVKTLRGVLELQRARLEQGMVTMRRWKADDFVAFLVKHPVMTHLTRRLVWGQFSAPTAVVSTSTFRVTDEGEFADAKDKPVKLDPAMTVGIVHPLPMSEADRNAWGQVFGDYEIVPPFPQLARPIHALEAKEQGETELHRIDDIPVNSGKVWGFTEKRGWDRGGADDHGVVSNFAKWYPAANVTAVFDIDPGIARGSIDMLGTDQTISRCYFMPGQFAASGDHRPRGLMRLGTVDAVAMSETLGDLYRLASKE